MFLFTWYCYDSACHLFSRDVFVEVLVVANLQAYGGLQMEQLPTRGLLACLLSIYTVGHQS